MTIVGDEDTPHGMVWVPTARGPYGELEDWQLVQREVAAEHDVRLWKLFR